ncbi:hypothetical protein HAP48_0043015 [Bradyrhizobium septentrionale]|uniref:Uncharacterized protein n=1 Tax=Bradyrhizobium septentrionale TaxID=1404411 RepID=A0A973W3H7_9BRAD|nr:hypothetical protein [Bradyrhizobium septentrionale]UGY15230.1 hypothetical protein HAP48_0043015 [Bradyrhizobium septentrionale]
MGHQLMPAMCRKGHPLIGDHVREERCRETRGGIRLRCKTCVKEQKRRWYGVRVNRELQLSYANWHRRGHPQGWSWPQVRERLIAEGIVP